VAHLESLRIECVPRHVARHDVGDEPKWNVHHAASLDGRSGERDHLGPDARYRQLERQLDPCTAGIDREMVASLAHERRTERGEHDIATDHWTVTDEDDRNCDYPLAFTNHNRSRRVGDMQQKEK
jgi:hypothetical protein